MLADLKAWPVVTAALLLALVGCGKSDNGTAADAATERQAALYEIEQVEKTWHQASSTHDVDLMMTLWAPDATFNIGTETLQGTTQIREFFTTKAGPFQPGNHWVSETPAYKLRATVNGDTGTLYFECHYVDVATGKVVAVVGADQDLHKVSGTWLIVHSAAATPTLEP